MPFCFSGIPAGDIHTSFMPLGFASRRSLLSLTEFAVQTRDKKYRYYFRNCFLSFRFFHTFFINVFFFTAFSHAEALSSYKGKKNFSFTIHAIQAQKVLSFYLTLYQTSHAEAPVEAVLNLPNLCAYAIVCA